MACLAFAIRGINKSNYQSDVGSKLGLSFFYFPCGWSEKPLPPSQQIRCKTGT